MPGRARLAAVAAGPVIPLGERRDSSDIRAGPLTFRTRHGKIRGTRRWWTEQAEHSMTITEGGTVTQWIALLRTGNEDAATQLWKLFIHRLRTLLRKQLHGPSYDEEDVALSSFRVLCRCLSEGRYPDLVNRDQLWRVLATIAVRKSRDYFESETCQKRGGPGHCTGDAASLANAASKEPGPEIEALMTDECQRLLALLENPRLKQVVMWKLEGYSHEEIAAKLGLTRWSVGRMLNCVREIWETQL